MKELSVRERIEAIQKEILAGDVSHVRQAEMVVQLSSLYGNCCDEVLKTELAFYDEINTHVLAGHAVNKAETIAKASAAYRHYRVAKDAEKKADKMMSALKAGLRMKEAEMRFGG